MTLPRYEPMLAVTRADPFTEPQWTFELKWDGVRVLAYWDGSRCELRSRRGLDVTVTYPELGGFTADRPCVLDGEIVALEEGRPSFQAIQGRMNVRGAQPAAAAAVDIPVTYVAFDLLHDGETLVDEPIEVRRDRLAALALPAPFVRSDVHDDGLALYDFVRERGLEGMVAKRRGSRYQSGVRSPDWVKVPHYRYVSAVVGGFTAGEGGRAATFGSLVVGLWTEDGLAWIGTVGSGFSDRAVVEIRRALDQMTIGDSPFLPHPDLPPGITWVEPRLVASVQYKEVTRQRRLRAPVFVGFTGEPPESATDL